MLIAHFTNEQSARNIIENGIKLPLYLTTNFELGSNYGSHLALFKVSDDIEDFARISRVGSNGNGTVNKATNGMIEYIIETPKQLRNFLDAVEGSGVRHIAHLAAIVEQQRKERLEKESKLKEDKPKRTIRSKLRM